jgi:hypothetical protein
MLRRDTRLSVVALPLTYAATELPIRNTLILEVARCGGRSIKADL